MKKTLFLIIAIIILSLVLFGLSEYLEKDVQVQDSVAALITLTSPQPNELVSSPLVIHGEARGYWFFEASFPVFLTNWDGLIIAEGIAQAQSEWMTEDFVPYNVTLEFVSPYKSGSADFMQKGTLILQRDNPSDLPENDAAIEIPLSFKPHSS